MGATKAGREATVPRLLWGRTPCGNGGLRPAAPTPLLSASDRGPHGWGVRGVWLRVGGDTSG